MSYYFVEANYWRTQSIAHRAAFLQQQSYLFIKFFKTSNIRIVELCQELFHFELPSVQLARRRKVFLDKFCV